MGHQRSFCAITHVPIMGRCVGIWTKKPRFETDEEFAGELADSPFVRGATDTYLRIDADPDQEYLIKHISKSLKERGPSMFIDELVFDEILKIGVSKFGHGIDSGLATEYSDLDVYSLNLLGFKLTGEKSGDERYKQIMVHPDFKSLRIFTDGRWSKVVKNNNPKHIDVYTPKGLLKYFKTLDLTPLEIDARLHEVNKILSSLEHTAKKSSGDKFYDALMSMIASTSADKLHISPKMLELRHTMPDLNVKLAEVWNIRAFMHANNLKFGFRFKGGPQDGNIEAHAQLCRIMKLAHDRNKRDYA